MNSGKQQVSENPLASPYSSENVHTDDWKEADAYNARTSMTGSKRDSKDRISYNYYSCHPWYQLKQRSLSHMPAENNDQNVRPTGKFMPLRVMEELTNLGSSRQ